MIVVEESLSPDNNQWMKCGTTNYEKEPNQKLQFCGYHKKFESGSQGVVTHHVIQEEKEDSNREFWAENQDTQSGKSKCVNKSARSSFEAKKSKAVWKLRERVYNLKRKLRGELWQFK